MGVPNFSPYYEARASVLDSGDKVFLGVGIGLDASSTDGPLPFSSSSEFAFRREINAGFIYAGGLSWETDSDGSLASVGAAGGKAGGGYGVMNATGTSSTTRVSTASFGEMWDYAVTEVNGWFGDTPSSPRHQADLCCILRSLTQT